MNRPRVLSPVLLLGGGPGEASCGILYLAGYLRRHGIEAFVRLYDGDESDDEVVRSIASLVAHLRPRLVGISLKWFHHLDRALLIARAVRRIDPEVRVVLGGNTASCYWQDLAALDCVDDVVLGDGELPLLCLCRGDASPPNCVAGGTAKRAPFGYVQGAANREVYYSHFGEIFVSQLDLHSFSGWVAPGKGCGESCLYCGGGRATHRQTFGRAEPFLRPSASVRRDHLEISPRVWQLRYDFSGGTAAYLKRTWAGLDLTGHSCTYFLWGAPPRALIDALARTFRRAYLILDVGCFSESQRAELVRRGLLKPCPSDRDLLAAIELCLRHENLELEVCGIAGLPFTSERALVEEQRLVEHLLGRGCSVGAQRLEAQPGAPVTEHAERFQMRAEARHFTEFLSWFSRRDPAPRTSVPMVRFVDRAVERAVQRSCERLERTVRGHTAAVAPFIDARTKLQTTIASTLHFELCEWLGRHTVPERAAHEPVTVVRAVDGAGLACAPGLSPRRFADPRLQQGPAGSAILGVLAAFARPTSVEAGLARLWSEGQLDPALARGIVDRLAAARFLQPP